MSYEVLKNRLTNGNAFLLQTALDRINALADALEITQEQADELSTILQAIIALVESKIDEGTEKEVVT